jgi:hypothetical protein
MVRIFVAILLTISFTLKAQRWDFSTPEKLNGNVNTSYEETLPLLSPDGTTLYFSRVLYPQNVGGKFSGSDIWVSQFDTKVENWSKATNPKDHFNNEDNNAVIGVHQSGDILYLLNTNARTKTEGIYFSKKVNNRWMKPEFIPIPGIEAEGFFGAYVSPDYDVIILSMKAPDSFGAEDLYISLKGAGGQWSKPRNLGPSINTSGFEISPFLSADKRRLYFSSNGHKGYGDADIFYCERLYNSWDTWSAARNLGDKLNSKKFDAYFSIYGDSLAYFSSNRNSTYADIYRVKVVPGNELLSFGQRYLTKEETNEIIGPKVSRKISFEHQTTRLDAIQRELLFYIANKLVNNPAIGIQLLLAEENDPALTEARVNAITEHLRSAGLEPHRIIFTDSEKVKKRHSSRSSFELILFADQLEQAQQPR